MIFSKPKERQNKMELIKQMTVMTVKTALKRGKKIKLAVTNMWRHFDQDLSAVCRQLVILQLKMNENFRNI